MLDDHAEEITVLRAQLSVERERTRQLEAQLRNLADHDPVTDLLNHQSVVRVLEDHLAACARYGPAGALLLVGLDGFGDIVRTRGYTEADKALAALAEVIAERLRTTDIVGRWDSDELAVVLPRAGEDEVTNLADILVGLVGEVGTPSVPAGSLTASIGVAVVSNGGDGEPLSDLTQLVGRARREMAVARIQGGSRVAAGHEAPA